jgi:hypothetical protein
MFDLDMQYDEHSNCGAISRSFKHPASAFCLENMIEFFWFVAFERCKGKSLHAKKTDCLGGIQRDTSSTRRC